MMVGSSQDQPKLVQTQGEIHEILKLKDANMVKRRNELDKQLTILYNRIQHTITVANILGAVGTEKACLSAMKSQLLELMYDFSKTSQRLIRKEVREGKLGKAPIFDPTIHREE